MSEIWQLIKDIVHWFKNRKNQDFIELKKDYKERIQRYFEDAQKRDSGSFAPTEDNLFEYLKPDLLDDKELSIYRKAFKEALSELIPKVLEYQSGSYYLKGHEPHY